MAIRKKISKFAPIYIYLVISLLVSLISRTVVRIKPWQLGFQDAATPMMEGIIDLHHDILFFLILILVFVLWILVRALWHFHWASKQNKS